MNAQLNDMARAGGRALACKMGLWDLYRSRLYWLARFDVFHSRGYPAIVWQEAVDIDYRILPVLDAAIDYKLTHQLPAFGERRPVQ